MDSSGSYPPRHTADVKVSRGALCNPELRDLRDRDWGERCEEPCVEISMSLEAPEPEVPARP